MLQPDLTAAKAIDAADNGPVAPVQQEAQANVDITPTGEGTKAEGSPSEPTQSEGSGKTKEEGGSELAGLLEETGLTSIDELKDLVNSDKSLKELLGDRKLEDILEKAGKLEALEQGWAKEEEARRREEEEPEETIARLDAELAKANEAKAQKAEANKSAAEAKQMVDAYDSTVNSLVDATDLPESHKGLMKYLLNSSTPVSLVDIGNKADVRNMTKELQTKLKAFSDGVIEDYVAGKSAVPAISPSAPVASESGKGESPKTIQQATSNAVARLKKVLGG